MTLTRTQQELDDRYGRARGSRGRRWAWIGVGVVAVAAVGYLGWTTVAQTTDAVDIDVTGFHLVDEHRVTVDFQVTLRQGEPVTCIIEAQDTEHGIVGWRVVETPPTPPTPAGSARRCRRRRRRRPVWCPPAGSRRLIRHTRALAAAGAFGLHPGRRDAARTSP